MAHVVPQGGTAEGGEVVVVKRVWTSSELGGVQEIRQGATLVGPSKAGKITVIWQYFSENTGLAPEDTTVHTFYGVLSVFSGFFMLCPWLSVGVALGEAR